MPLIFSASRTKMWKRSCAAAPRNCLSIRSVDFALPRFSSPGLMPASLEHSLVDPAADRAASRFAATGLAAAGFSAQNGLGAPRQFETGTDRIHAQNAGAFRLAAEISTLPARAVIENRQLVVQHGVAVADRSRLVLSREHLEGLAPLSITASGTRRRPVHDPLQVATQCCVEVEIPAVNIPGRGAKTVIQSPPLRLRGRRDQCNDHDNCHRRQRRSTKTRLPSEFHHPIQDLPSANGGAGRQYGSARREPGAFVRIMPSAAPSVPSRGRRDRNRRVHLNCRLFRRCRPMMAA